MMDENVWQVCQIFMAIIGIQTGLIIAFLWLMWYSISQKFEAIDKRFDSIDRRFETMDKRFEKMEEKMNVFENRLIAIETMLHMKECCILHHEHHKKAE